MKNEWVDIEKELNAYIENTHEQSIYVGDDQFKGNVSTSMSKLEWNRWLEANSDNLMNKVDMLCLDTCMSFDTAAELWNYLQQLYHLMNHDSQLILTFKDSDVILSLSDRLEDRDSIDYIQRHLFYCDEPIQTLFFNKSWEEKAAFVTYEKLSSEFRAGMCSNQLLTELLEQVGFHILRIENGRTHCLEKARHHALWVEELEYKTIIAKKYEPIKSAHVYIVERTLDAISKQEGPLDVTLQNVCAKNKIEYTFIYLDEMGSEELYDRSKVNGVQADNVASVYHLYTDLKLYPITYTVHEFLQRFQIHKDAYTLEQYEDYLVLKLKDSTECKLLLTEKGYLHTAEMYIDGLLVNKLTFTYTLVSEERFLYEGESVVSKEKLFFKENGRVAYSYEQIGDECVFYLEETTIESKEAFYQYMIEKVSKKEDIILYGEEEYHLLHQHRERMIDPSQSDEKQMNDRKHKVVKKGTSFIFEKEYVEIPLYIDFNKPKQQRIEIFGNVIQNWYNVLK